MERQCTETVHQNSRRSNHENNCEAVLQTTPGRVVMVVASSSKTNVLDGGRICSYESSAWKISSPHWW
eukprot:2215604-Amphidinium_carterae.1